MRAELGCNETAQNLQVSRSKGKCLQVNRFWQETYNFLQINQSVMTRKLSCILKGHKALHFLMFSNVLRSKTFRQRYVKIKFHAYVSINDRNQFGFRFHSKKFNPLTMYILKKYR